MFIIHLQVGDSGGANIDFGMWCGKLVYQVIGAASWRRFWDPEVEKVEDG